MLVRQMCVTVEPSHPSCGFNGAAPQCMNGGGDYPVLQMKLAELYAPEGFMQT